MWWVIHVLLLLFCFPLLLISIPVHIIYRFGEDLRKWGDKRAAEKAKDHKPGVYATLLKEAIKEYEDDK